MATNRAPKQWTLSKTETITTFESWRQNVLYILALDPQFAPFLGEGATWEKKTRTRPNRGFADDNEDIAIASRRTANQKATMLDLMLGQVANYCPIVSRNTIVKNSKSMDDIWQTLRSHFGFQSSGGHFLDFCEIKLQAGERHEDLYQRLMAFVEDNLLTVAGGIRHMGEPPQDEEITPTLENLIVLTWLRLLHDDLPRLVKQRYGTELRSRTLASIKPEISQAMDTLLDECRSNSSINVMRSVGPTSYRQKVSRGPPKRCCPLCSQAGKDSNHFLSRCQFLPDADRKFMTKIRHIGMESEECEEDITQIIDNEHRQPSAIMLVQPKKSPYLFMYYDSKTLKVTLDTGAETNMIRHSTAKQLGLPTYRSSQNVHQADGKSPLKVTGETKVKFVRGSLTFTFHALVVEDLDVDILGGVPFTDCNDISIRTSKQLIILEDGSKVYYKVSESETRPSVRRTQPFILRSPSHVTVWPGDFIEIKLPEEVEENEQLALEPRSDENTCEWPSPHIVTTVGGMVRLSNQSSGPITLKKHQHFGQVSPVFEPKIHNNGEIMTLPDHKSSPVKACSNAIQIDPDNILPQDIIHKFQTLHSEYEEVFNPNYPGYNGAAGEYSNIVNMGPVQPPQRKGRIPQYNRSKLQELQDKCDELECQGVLRRPEEMGVVAEYLNPSFLVKKTSGGYRLVTAFAEVGRYSKPQPALMPDVDSTLQLIAQWQYIILSDLTSAFYQIPLAKTSMKYCGIVTPFRGVRVYTRAAMGMPGSETALEEVMSRVLGDLLHEGVATKLADDLYCGGNTPEDLLRNWGRVLEAFSKCALRLSASKTIIAPHTTVILGWVWSQGTLRASPHRISTLSSCLPPKTVRGLRSYIGAYKVLARVLPGCSSTLASLDDAVAGRSSIEPIEWSDDLLQIFKCSQSALSDSKVITLPRPEDQLFIVTDGAVKNRGIGATMYVMRSNKPVLAGFFSAKLRAQQIRWLPCEVEALGIATAIKHFSPFITQSHHATSILTDSKPCVQAFGKLCRGEFSSSPRVSTFLSTASRFQVTIRHLAGSANVPSDFASRNAPACDSPVCQICQFIITTEDSVVHSISTTDILSGDKRLPFTSRSAWRLTQQECPDLRRSHAHLKQGTRPSKKITDARDVKRYLQVVTIAKDGLIVVRREHNMAQCKECIVVPRQVIDGLLVALHLKLNHPTAHQLKVTFTRFFYCLDMDQSITRTTDSCHQCVALKPSPQFLQPQTTSDPPEAMGVVFAADIICRERQFVLVVRECITSYTRAIIIDNEKHDTLREALITLCTDLHPSGGPLSVIRTDAGPGFVALNDDVLLKHHHLCIEIGNIKNPNKNPVAERAVQELEREILKHDPTGGPVTAFQLTLIVSQLNSRIRNRGLSAREMLYKRDQFCNSSLPISDQQLAIEQHDHRMYNHPHSETSKAPNRHLPPENDICVGDLVYLYSDGSKTKGRSRYLVVTIEGMWCNVRKFIGNQLRATSYRVKKHDCYKVTPDYHTEVVRPSIDDELYTSDYTEEIIQSDTDSPIGNRPEYSMEATNALEHQPDINIDMLPQPTPPDPPDIPKEISSSDPPLSQNRSPLPTPPVSRPQRNRKAPSYLKDYVVH